MNLNRSRAAVNHLVFTKCNVLNIIIAIKRIHLSLVSLARGIMAALAEKLPGINFSAKSKILFCEPHATLENKSLIDEYGYTLLAD